MIEQFVFDSNILHYLTAYKQISSSLFVSKQCYLQTIRLQIIHIWYICIFYIYIYIYVCVCVCVCKQDFALNNLQGLIHHKSQRANKSICHIEDALFMNVANDITNITLPGNF